MQFGTASDRTDSGVLDFDGAIDRLRRTRRVMQLAVAACLTGCDVERVRALPNTSVSTKLKAERAGISGR